MRINFEKVKYKNILSTGNVFTTVELNIVPSTLIAGSNGSGKSTLLDAIVFGLYGRPFRNINKAQLVNSINNKELIVELYSVLWVHWQKNVCQVLRLISTKTNTI